MFQVFIHNPHTRSQRSGRMTASVDSDISLLNINQQISSVAAGQLDANSMMDALIVGTQTNVMAYDVELNQDLFYKDVSSKI